MRKFVYLLAFGGLLAFLSAPAGAQSSTDRSPDRSATTQFNSGSATISGSQTSVSTTDVPKQYFMAARSAFNNKDFTACAQNLRQGADVLRSDAARAHGDVADNLRGTAKDLDKLAERAQRGELRSLDALNDKFGDAYRNLADYHYQVANESYQRNRTANMPAGRDVETGNALNAAANDMENWSEVTGRTLKTGTRTAINETRDLAGKMISGTGWATEKAGSAINNFGEAIRDFGHDVGHNALHPIRAHQERVRERQERQEAPSVPPVSPGTQY